MAKKTVELTEEEIQQINTDARLRSTLGQIMKHPKARILAQQAHKLVDATANTPDLDDKGNPINPLEPALSAVDQLRADMLKDKTDREAKERLDALQSNINAGLNKLRQDGWTADGIKAVEKIMEEKGIIDTEVAAAYYERLHPPQDLVTPGSTGAWNFMEMPADTSDDLKKLIESKGESVPLLDKMARDALNEVRGQQRR